MKRFSYLFLWCVLIGCVSSSCNHSMEPSVYLRWLNNPENGVVLSKKNNGFIVTVKYLPTDYFISKELIKTKDIAQADSIRSLYKDNVYFIMHIDNDPEKIEESADIMFRDIHGYPDYAERVYNLNFSLEESIELKIGDATYNPVLTSLENHYGLDGGRNIIIVFSPQKKNQVLNLQEGAEFIYDDQTFGMGQTHFYYSAETFNNIPDLAIQTN